MLTLVIIAVAVMLLAAVVAAAGGFGPRAGVRRAAVVDRRPAREVVVDRADEVVERRTREY